MQAMLPSSSGAGVFTPDQLPSSAEEAGRQIDDTLLNAEDRMALSKWDEAAAELDALPEHARRLPHVVLVYLDLTIGQQLWDRGLMHALGLLEARPHDPELWLRIARLMAGAGYQESARLAAERCLKLNPESYFFLVKNGLVKSRTASSATAGAKASNEHLSSRTKLVA
jgi:hypothetical protein